MADEHLIKPFSIERVCEPRLDVTQLSFKTVDVTESVYTRTLIHLQGASLPAGILAQPRRAGGGSTSAGSQPASGVLARMRDTIFNPGESIEPPPPVKPPPPFPLPPAQPVDEPEPPPTLVPYDLFIMLKYRQDWRPTGYGIGELLYTTSLMPNEELVLEMKTWETSRVQQDSEDSTDQRNVSDIKTTASNSSEATTEAQTKTHESIDAKGSYSGFGATASVEGSWAQDVADLQKDIEKRTQDRAQQTTSEFRATHKVRIATSRESGSESKTTRRLRNINQAHTLNVSYYEVLREYAIEMTPYEVTVVLLGAEPDLVQPCGYSTWYGDHEPLSLGHLIRAVQSSSWVQEFIDAHGVSPIKVLRERWSAPLYDAALVRLEWWAEQGVEIRPQDREEFQRTVLRYVRPASGWIEPDEKGALRWAYEVIEGKERDLLQYLYEFMPYSPQQLLARAVAANMKTVAAAKALTATFARAVVPSLERSSALRAARVEVDLPRLDLQPSDSILVPGPFYNVPASTPDGWREFAGRWVDKQVIEQLDKLREGLGSPTKSWKTVLPTQGVYSDLALGICSGAEDYLEIARQFDLELKRLEIEKLKLEVAKLRLENQGLQAGKPQVLVETDAQSTSVNLTLNVPDASSKVEIKKPGA